MTVDLARRGMLKALGLASSMVAGPGKAIAQAAIGVAGVMPAVKLAGSIYPPDASSPYDGLGDTARYAVSMLEREAWGSTPIADATMLPRPSIACFRSASPTSKAIWEHNARKSDDFHRQTIQAAIRMITSGKIPM